MRSLTERIRILSLLVLILFDFHSCATSPNLVIHQSSTLSVELRELPAGYPSLQPFHHPYMVQPKELLDILESLNYDASSFFPFSRSQPRRVLTKLQVELLAPELSRALTQALPRQVAAFMIADAEKPDRRTKGLVFVHDAELHVIIEELHRLRYEGEQPTYQQPVSRWSLLPTGKQRLHARHPEGKGAIANWIITPLR